LLKLPVNKLSPVPAVLLKMPLLVLTQLGAKLKSAAAATTLLLITVPLPA
jgi:hypothetical protein